MNSELQRSYNWCYGAVRMAERMLPFVVKGFGMGRSLDSGVEPVRRFRAILVDVAEELRTLATYVEAERLGAAAEELEHACAMMAAFDEAVLSGEQRHAERTIRDALIDVTRAKTQMDGQTILKFRHWLLNPWKNRPRRIGAALPMTLKPPLDH